MKRYRKRLAFLALSCFFLTACGSADTPTGPSGSPSSAPVESEAAAPAEHVEYAGSIQLDMTSSTAKAEVTVKTYVDGDTVHFHAPTDVMEDGVLKARFLAVNTPESTGKVEEYGKTASLYTKAVLSEADAILVESGTEGWDLDATGSRCLVWVWYKPAGADEYRNLNIELLQQGLALANGAGTTRYGETALAAVTQARNEKLNLYSGQPDPNFYYGDAIELTVKELRLDPESYMGMQVAFHGYVSANSGSNGVYVEEYDAETDMYFGIYAYYGFNLSGGGLDVLSVGNEVRIVGTMQYYETGGTWQVAGLTYREFKPDDPGNIQKLSSGHSAAYVLTDPETFAGGEVTIETEEGEYTAPYAQMVQATSVEMRDLTVVDVYTTTDEDSSAKGAMTLTCEANGATVTVRTAVLTDENGDVITAERYLNKTIDVKGIVDSFSGSYQIKVFTPNNITIH